MKRQWSHQSVVLPLLVAVFLLLTFRCSLRHAQQQASSLHADDAGTSYAVHAMLVELAAVDPAASAVLRAAEALLQANLTRAPPERRDAVVRGLHDWLGKQRFEPQVMAELVDLIKCPMDLYAAGARGGDGDAPRRTRRAPWSATAASCWRFAAAGFAMGRIRGGRIDWVGGCLAGAVYSIVLIVSTD
jgi:beta-1,6-galactosyltransferase|eukprot:XP_020401871.1 sialyltransferase-like protein 3 [Zea mays]